MTKVPSLSGMPQYQRQEHDGPLPHRNIEERHQGTAPATPFPHDGWDAPPQNRVTASNTYVGPELAQDGKARTQQGEAGACPFDLTFRDRVRNVRYPLLVETLRSAHHEALSHSRAGQRPDPAREAAAQSISDARFASLAPTEQHLLVAALEQMSGPGAAIWSKRLTWPEERWRSAAEGLLDTITRGWLFMTLCEEHGLALLPYLDPMLESLSEARFCRPEG